MYLGRMWILLLVGLVLVRSVLLILLFKFCIHLLILCIVFLSIIESGLLKFPNLLLNFISPLNVFSFFFIYFGSLLGLYVVILVISS